MPQDRKEIANTVINDPASYKVCLVCGSIVDKLTHVCPNCNAYRFKEDSDAVVEQALILASRPQRSVTHLDLKLDE